MTCLSVKGMQRTKHLLDVQEGVVVGSFELRSAHAADAVEAMCEGAHTWCLEACQGRLEG